MNDNLKILIWAINESKELMIQTCSQLLETAKLFNIDYDLIGIGIRFKEHKQRIEILRAYLMKLNKNDMVLCMDGADTLFNQSSEQIVRKFKQASTRILFSAEKNYSHQYFHYKPIFDKISSDYRYLNAGTFIGYAGDLSEMLEEILEIDAIHPNANDQGLMGVWVSRYLDQPQKVKLDVDCHIFWVTAKDWQILLNVSTHHKYILNPNKHTKPSIIHVTGVGFSPHRQAYDAAYSTIINSSHKNSKNPQLVLLVSTPEVYDGVIWKKHNYKGGIGKPVWLQNNHPYISLFLYNKNLPDYGQYISTGYSYEAILRILNQRYIDYIAHVSNRLIIDIETLYETYALGFQFKKEKGSEYPKSENFIYHQGLYFSFDPPLLKVRASNEENLDILSYHHLYLQKRMKELEARNRKIEHEVIYLTEAINQHENLKEFQHSCFAYQDKIEAFDIKNIDKVIDRQVTDHNKSLPIILSNKQDIEFKKYLFNIHTRLKDSRPILFIYCAEGNYVQNEIKHLIRLLDKLKTKLNRNDRLVIILQDQGIGVVKLQMLDYNVMVWASNKTDKLYKPNQPETLKCYDKIIEYALDDFNWKYDEQQIKNHPTII